MFFLGNWYLEKQDNKVIGHGNCYGNPRFTEGIKVQTSQIKEVIVENENSCLKLLTESGSCYCLDYAEINKNALEYTQKAAAQLNISLDIINTCLSFRECKEKEMKQKLAAELQSGELYVRMEGGFHASRAYQKNADGMIEEVPVSIHVGTFADSVLLIKGESDWRFFPYGDSIKCYHWSEKLETVIIDNAGNDFIVRDSAKEGEGILCKQGEITVIKKEDYEKMC